MDVLQSIPSALLLLVFAGAWGWATLMPGAFWDVETEGDDPRPPERWRPDWALTTLPDCDEEED